MQMNNISALNSMSTSVIPQNVQPKEVQTPPKEIKDGKKKIALALGALAVAGVAAVAVGHALRSGKALNLSLDDFKAKGKFEKGFATFKNRPYNGTINVENKDGKYVLNYANGILVESTKYRPIKTCGIVLDEHVSKKIYSNKDGKSVVEEFAFGIKKGKNGETTFGWLNSPFKRTTVEGNEVIIERTNSLYNETLKDTTTFNKDGSFKQIIQDINMGDNLAEYHVVTKDGVTGEVLDDAVKTVKVNQTNSGKEADPIKKAMYDL